MKSFGTLLVVFLLSFTVFSQKKAKSDTLSINELKKVDKNDTIKKHSILKAALFSVVLPGAGQVYNSIAMPKGQKKAYWKVPLIYAGLGATGYFGVKNAITTKSIKTEYKFREASDFTTLNNPQWQEYDRTALAELYRKYSNQRNWCFIGMGIVYLLQVADAAVEAHFVSFDISENLTMQLQPTILGNPYTRTTNIGLNIALKFKK